MANAFCKQKYFKAIMASFLVLTICLLAASTAPIANATFVSLNKQHSPTGNFNPGQQIRFTITLEVRDIPGGSSLAIRHLNITDILPAGLSYVSGSESHTPTASFAQTGQQLFWDFGSATVLSSLPQAQITFNVTVNTGVTGLLVNQVTAEYIEDLTSVFSNPSATDSVLILAATPTPSSTPPPLTVGGEVETVNALQLLTPYLVIIALVSVLLSSVVLYIHKKRVT